jgi:kynurenine formamidase
MRPRYAELPNGDARTYFGEGDALGCLRLLTPERTRDAATLIRSGEVFALNGAIGEWPDPSPAGRDIRPAPSHLVYELVPETVYDDRLDGYYLQGGTQWDGFLHMRDTASGTWFHGSSDRLGIEVWARRGIAGRGVLLDLARWAADTGDPIDWRTRRVFDAQELLACASTQGVRVKEGTILLVRVGWEEGYRALTAAERLAHSPADPRRRVPVPGLAASESLAALLWDWGIAAIACDNPSLEATPYEVALADSLHARLLTRLGIPIGELWLLDELAAACARQRCWEFFLSSAPLNVPGGVGSPANALAVV